MTPLSPEAVPGTDDLEPSLHEPMGLLPKLREPNEADVIVAMGLEWGCGFSKAHQRLRRMNFVDYEFGASNG